MKLGNGERLNVYLLATIIKYGNLGLCMKKMNGLNWMNKFYIYTKIFGLFMILKWIKIRILKSSSSCRFIESVLNNVLSKLFPFVLMNFLFLLSRKKINLVLFETVRISFTSSLQFLFCWFAGVSLFFHISLNFL